MITSVLVLMLMRVCNERQGHGLLLLVYQGRLSCCCFAALCGSSGASSPHVSPSRTYRLDVPATWHVFPEFNVESLRLLLRGSAGWDPPAASEDPAAPAVQELLKFRMLYVLVLGWQRHVRRRMGAAGMADPLRGGHSFLMITHRPGMAASGTEQHRLLLQQQQRHRQGSASTRRSRATCAHLDSW
jgi:hypothetical protein